MDGRWTPTIGDRISRRCADRWRESFTGALDDDLNASDALAATFTMVREAQPGPGLAADAASSRRDRQALAPRWTTSTPVSACCRCGERGRDVGLAELDAWVEERIAARAAARAHRDFAVADAIRDELLDRGVALEDGPAGTRWQLVSKARLTICV